MEPTKKDINVVVAAINFIMSIGGYFANMFLTPYIFDTIYSAKLVYLTHVPLDYWTFFWCYFLLLLLIPATNFIVGITKFFITSNVSGD